MASFFSSPVCAPEPEPDPELPNEDGSPDKEHNHLSEMQISEYRKAFDHIDEDGSGFLDTYELMEALQFHAGQSEKITLKDAKELMKEIDTDGDGTISFDEFLIAAEKAKIHQKDDQHTSEFKMYMRMVKLAASPQHGHKKTQIKASRAFSGLDPSIAVSTPSDPIAPTTEGADIIIPVPQEELINEGMDGELELVTFPEFNPPADGDYENALVQIFKQHEPSKVAEVPMYVEHFKGREEHMLATLKHRYTATM